MRPSRLRIHRPHPGWVSENIDDIMESISEWLSAFDLNRYTQVFVENVSDLEMLPSLSQQNLESLATRAVVVIATRR